MLTVRCWLANSYGGARGGAVHIQAGAASLQLLASVFTGNRAVVATVGRRRLLSTTILSDVRCLFRFFLSFYCLSSLCSSFDSCLMRVCLVVCLFVCAVRQNGVAAGGALFVNTWVPTQRPDEGFGYVLRNLEFVSNRVDTDVATHITGSIFVACCCCWFVLLLLLLLLLLLELRICYAGSRRCSCAHIYQLQQHSA